jgi:putative endonuclease
VTSDVAHRIAQHKAGEGSAFSKRYGLNRLVYAERYEDIRDAIEREKILKHWQSACKVRLIAKDNPDWNDLAV